MKNEFSYINYESLIQTWDHTSHSWHWPLKLMISNFIEALDYFPCVHKFFIWFIQSLKSVPTKNKPTQLHKKGIAMTYLVQFAWKSGKLTNKQTLNFLLNLKSTFPKGNEVQNMLDHVFFQTALVHKCVWLIDY